MSCQAITEYPNTGIAGVYTMNLSQSVECSKKLTLSTNDGEIKYFKISHREFYHLRNSRFIEFYGVARSRLDERINRQNYNCAKAAAKNNLNYDLDQLKQTIPKC